ncbi:MAG TPA: succinate--CoA ligase subunit alpha [Candidatus Gracilibacteria bacterium]|nr:succinate--CoA ligase subunit alpha [Candidatus Gracilibacteria bacterium]
MAILIDKNTRVIVQGITGHHGSFHAQKMAEYGTQIVAGVTPGKGGEVLNFGAQKIPVYNSVDEALKEHAADYSIIFVPAEHAREASLEAINAGLHIVIITEHIPVSDTLLIIEAGGAKNLRVIGPNCPGIITPKECKIGIMPGDIFKKGHVGVISRSGTLTYEIVQQLSDAGIGQSTVLGIGGDMVNGVRFTDALALMEKDDETRVIILIGEIGGDAEERAAAFIRKNIRKPVVAYIAGKTAPEGKTMGHAGAIISGKSGTFSAKTGALKNAGVHIADMPHDTVHLVKKILE